MSGQKVACKYLNVVNDSNFTTKQMVMAFLLKKSKGYTKLISNSWTADYLEKLYKCHTDHIQNPKYRGHPNHIQLNIGCHL